jgi:ribosomal protein L30/L7E
MLLIETADMNPPEVGETLKQLGLEPANHGVESSAS